VFVLEALYHLKVTSARHVKCMKYFASAGHWLVATGSYAGGAFQWLSVKAIAARLDTASERNEFEYTS
jgi:hypothetical protein